MDELDNFMKNLENEGILSGWSDFMSKKLRDENAEYAKKNDFCVPDPCKHCSNHPSNGGSGICHCTLGGQRISWT